MKYRLGDMSWKEAEEAFRKSDTVPDYVGEAQACRLGAGVAPEGDPSADSTPQEGGIPQTQMGKILAFSRAER